MKRLLIISLLFPLLVLADKNTVDTNLLLTLDLDQMSQMVREHINRAQDIAIKTQDEGAENEGGVLYELKKATLLVLARPNRDNMTVKLLPDIEKQLNAYNAYHSTLISLNNESARILKDKEAPIKVKSAYYYIVENTLAELKPELLKKDANAIKVYQAIANANIDIPKKLSQFRLLEKMESGDFDPSGYARSLLKKININNSKKSWWQFWK